MADEHATSSTSRQTWRDRPCLRCGLTANDHLTETTEQSHLQFFHAGATVFGLYCPSEPPVKWYWAIFKDHHELGKIPLLSEIVTEWFEKLDEAQAQMQHHDRNKYRIHGVLRSEDD